MSSDGRSRSCGAEEPAEPLAPAHRTAASLPPLQTFEELGLPASFQKAVEEELTRDEKLVWVGRPSQNQAVQPPKTALVAVGAVLLGLAVLLPLFSISFIFSVVL